MSWANLDDRLAVHRKFIRLRMQGTDGLAAIGLWTLCLTWAHAQTRDQPPDQQGVIPPEIVEDYAGLGADRLTELLADVPPGSKAGLWEPLGDGWWRIHEFRYWQQLHIREAQSAAGKRGARKRWGIPEGQETLFEDASMQVDSSPIGSPNGLAIEDPIAPTPPHPNKESPNGLSPSIAVAFDEFYAAYPRKREPRRAKAAFARAVKRAPVNEIMRGMRRYAAAHPPGSDMTYVKHPATWLNGDCWAEPDDDLPLREDWRDGPNRHTGGVDWNRRRREDPR